MFLIKKKSYVLGIACIFIFLNLAVLPTEGITYNALPGKKEKQTLVMVVPDYLKPGDLYFCECKNKDLEPGWDHCGIYIGDDTFIEAVPGEVWSVWRTNLTVIQTWAKNITYGTVKTSNESQRQNAIKFAESQLGKPYAHSKCFLIPWFKRPKDPSPDAEAWYCSELVWAAYYNQCIDIDRNGNKIPYVGPTEISSDDDIEMYTYHKLNKFYLGRNIEWLIKKIFNIYN